MSLKDSVLEWKEPFAAEGPSPFSYSAVCPLLMGLGASAGIAMPILGAMPRQDTVATVSGCQVALCCHGNKERTY